NRPGISQARGPRVQGHSGKRSPSPRRRRATEGVSPPSPLRAMAGQSSQVSATEGAQDQGSFAHLRAFPCATGAGPMSDTERKLPLDSWHRARGGRMVPFAGYAMPVQYEGIMAEHRWTRESAGLFDVSHMGQVIVAGPEAEKGLE